MRSMKKAINEYEERFSSGSRGAFYPADVEQIEELVGQQIGEQGDASVVGKLAALAGLKAGFMIGYRCAESSRRAAKPKGERKRL